MRRTADKSGQTGVATVEFTIVLPLLLFLILAVAEFGRAFLHYNQLTRAVQDSSRMVATKAARGASGTVYLDPTLVTEAKNLVVYGNVGGTGTPLLPGLTPTNVTIADKTNGNVSVLVTYTYQPIIGGGLPDLLLGGTINTGFTLRAEVIMRFLS